VSFDTRERSQEASVSTSQEARHLSQEARGANGEGGALDQAARLSYEERMHTSSSLSGGEGDEQRARTELTVAALGERAREGGGERRSAAASSRDPSSFDEQHLLQHHERMHGGGGGARAASPPLREGNGTHTTFPPATINARLPRITPHCARMMETRERMCGKMCWDSKMDILLCLLTAH
jgi:hypothetical protein